ncbi:DUF4142 domain-containing protein [Pontibacter liquoris]|uniref:DUF4142 domain-containing protein n=1 Tax=Pontibacter liquoris TaxID=2905677 RepID=UPI001FA6B9A3|nr:DUF4142 domain-containing protein [Pontibacter liquoris]
MKKQLLSTCLLFGALALYACNKSAEEKQAVNGTDTVTADTTAAADTTLTENQRELIGFAAQNNMLQIELGKIALQKGATNQVKQYGQQLIDWYTQKQKELQDIAQQFSVALPQQMGDEQQDYVAEVQKTAAGKFDQKYWDSVVDAQKEAISKYEDALRDVTPTNGNALTLWAQKTHQELRAQMEQAAAMRMQQKGDQ